MTELNLCRKRRFHRLISKEDLAVDIVVGLLCIILIIVTLYPFLNILAISFNDVTDTMYGLNGIFPRVFTVENYRLILSDGQIYISLVNSVLRTVIGTACSVIVCTVCAYLVYSNHFIFRKPFTIMLIVTMYVSGGMIPEFILMRELNLLNSFAVYILPNLVFAFNVILMTSFMMELPESIIESAKMDGAGEMTVLFKMVIPLSMPIIATIALFCAVGQWSSWFDVMLYNRGIDELSTLQYELQKKMQSASGSIGGGSGGQHGSGDKPSATPESIQATMTIIATVPILIVYPFLQKYFVKGITLGGVKG